MGSQPQSRNPNMRTEFAFFLIEDSIVTNMTHGGIQVYTIKKGARFNAQFVVSSCPTYTVIQNGLNFYVFETKSIPPEFLDRPMMVPEGEVTQ